MKFVHILTRLKTEPWFITEPALQGVVDLLESRLLNGSQFSVRSEQLPGAPSVPAAGAEEEPPYDLASATAIVPINGVLGHHLSMLERSCGGVDYGMIVGAVRDAMANPQVGRVLLHFQRCPGGLASGVTEAYGQLVALRAQFGKRLISVVDGQCCSAGIYLAAASDAIFCTESAELGCVGSMLRLTDRTAANEKEGIKRFVIKSARLKDIGNPDRPATEEEMKHLQAQIDFLGGLIVRDVRAGRAAAGATVAEEVFETGLTWFGQQAVQRGLADGVVESVDSLVGSLR